MPPSLRVLALFAHPDDCEFLCAGTLCHLAESGASLHIATMTAGDCGSTSLPPAKIARLRRNEARRAAKQLRAEYTCLEDLDLLVVYDSPTLRKVMELVRTVNPSLVFTHAPKDYMVDHEVTSRLCQTACFGASAPNFRTRARRPAKATRAIPHLYYSQPFGNRDILGEEVQPKIVVDIGTTLVRKESLLACHKSQRAWLNFQQSLPGLGEPVRQMAARAGALAGCEWGEGFRQHLGQGYPQTNLLADLLGERVRVIGRA